MIANPRKGRYFAISPGQVRRLVEPWRFYISDGERRAGTASFENPFDLRDIHPVIHLDSPHRLTVFSLPEDADQRIGTRAIKEALMLCGSLSSGWVPVRGNVWQSFVIYLGDMGTLVVAERLVRFKPKNIAARRSSRVHLNLRSLKPRREKFAVSTCNRPSNPRLERTGAQPARYGRASVGAGRSTAGR